MKNSKVLEIGARIESWFEANNLTDKEALDMLIGLAMMKIKVSEEPTEKFNSTIIYMHDFFAKEIREKDDRRSKEEDGLEMEIRNLFYKKDIDIGRGVGVLGGLIVQTMFQIRRPKDDFKRFLDGMYRVYERLIEHGHSENE